MTEQANNEAAKSMQIAEYNATAAALGELRQKYENVIFPVETTKGMKDAVAARRELRELRVGLEKMRKELKAPALLRCQLIDSEAKDITAQLSAMEEPIDKQIKIEEDRKEREKAEKERVERERVDAIRAKISAISGLHLDSAKDSSTDIEITIKELEGIELSGDEYAEFLEEALAAKQKALAGLQSLLLSVKVREEEVARLAEERAELDKLRAEAAERERELKEEREAIARERAELEAMKAKASAPIDTPAQEPVAEEDPAQQDETIAFDLTNPPRLSDQVDADSITRELANYTAMQFFAMSRKVRAVGNEVFADELNTVAENLQTGHFNEFIKTADWMEMANADKEMALASHATVALICGDEEMGAAVLRTAA